MGKMCAKIGLFIKITAILCALVCGVCGCAPELPPDDGAPKLAEKEQIMKYDEYNPDAWLKPVWDTREVYNETVMFVGEEDSARLLYKPTQILSVRNYGLDTEYVKGVDYEITQDGRIKRFAGSAMPYFEVDEYFRTAPDSVGIGVFGQPAGFKFEEKRYFKYGEEDTFTSKQIAVTYTHDSVWEGSVPKGKSGRFAKLIAKLKDKRKITAVFYGDSITTGCNASGMPQGGNTAPHTPSFDKMVCDRLTEKFGGEIEIVNTAVGGMNTQWGLDNIEERVIKYAPDFVVIAFGMNDPDLTVAKYKRTVTDMIDAIAAKYPDCEILTVATTVPNNESDWYYGNQKTYIKGLEAIEADPAYPFVSVADMTTMHLDLLKKKRFRDMTGNNINHPNDFLVRVYAQVILKTIIG